MGGGFVSGCGCMGFGKVRVGECVCIGRKGIVGYGGWIMEVWRVYWIWKDERLALCMDAYGVD